MKIFADAFEVWFLKLIMGNRLEAFHSYTIFRDLNWPTFLRSLENVKESNESLIS